MFYLRNTRYNNIKIKFLTVPSCNTTKGLFDRWIVVRHKEVVDATKNRAVKACEVGPTGRRAQYQAQKKRHHY